MSDLRVGVLGYGMRASLAPLAHRPGEGSRVVAVGDPRPGSRADARARLGEDIALEEDVEGLLRHGLDAVLVLTPDHLHVEHALATLSAGVPTFLEKPLAITTQGCDQLLHTAYTTGTRLYVGHNMRHMPVVRTMRQAILDGLIGEVKAVWCRHFVSAGGDYYFKDWHAQREHTTSLLLQKGAHDIDVIHWLADGASTRVSAMGGLTVYGGLTDRRDNTDRMMGQWYSTGNWPPLEQRELAPDISVEDISMATMVLDNGVFATYQQCHYTPDYWRNYTVIGTKGRLENIGDEVGAVVKVWTSRSDAYRDEPDVVLPVADEEGGHGGADPLLIAEFLRFAREGGQTMTSPLAARAAVAAGCAATQSLRGRGGAIDVPALDPLVADYFERGQVRAS